MVAMLLGKKLGMTQVFNEKSDALPVTALRVGPCVVMQAKTEKTDGYGALQLGFEDKKEKHATKPEIGHAKKANTAPKRFVREVPWDGQGEVKPGDVLTLKELEGIELVDVTGITKGRGFQGVVKRHGFKGGPKTHGQSDRTRAPGAISSSASPSRVMKGKRMPGHMGQARRTVQNLKVVSMDPETHTLLVKGAVAGANGSYVLVQRAKKGRHKKHHHHTAADAPSQMPLDAIFVRQPLIQRPIQAMLFDLVRRDAQQVVQRRLTIPILRNVQLARRLRQPRQRQHSGHRPVRPRRSVHTGPPLAKA